MKLFAFILCVFCLLEKGFTQCPQSGLNIQSESCEIPTNLMLDRLSCVELKVSWQGQPSRNYKVKANSNDSRMDQTSDLKVTKNFCDGTGKCSATIAVKNSTIVNWSVQSICTQNGNSITGYEIKGPIVSVPSCPNIVSNSPSIRVYPTPTTGVLNIDYSGKVTSNTVFAVYDLSGKKILSVSGNAVGRSNTGYHIDLRGHLSGTYLLKINNGIEQSQAKFILMTR